MNNAAHIVVGVVGILLVVGVWREYATDVRGQQVSGGHFPAEEDPGATLSALQDFLSDPEPTQLRK